MIQTFITMRITKMSTIQSLPLSLNEGRQTQTGNVYHYHVHDEEKLRFQFVVLPKLTLRLLLIEKVLKNMIRQYSKLKIHLLKFQGVVLILNHLGGILMWLCCFSFKSKNQAEAAQKTTCSPPPRQWSEWSVGQYLIGKIHWHWTWTSIFSCPTISSKQWAVNIFF